MKKVLHFLTCVGVVCLFCGSAWAFPSHFLNTAPNYSFLGSIPKNLLDRKFYFYEGKRKTNDWIMFQHDLKVTGFDGCYPMQGGYSGNSKAHKLRIALRDVRPKEETKEKNLKGSRCLKNKYSVKKDLYNGVSYRLQGDVLILKGHRHYLLKADAKK